MQQRYASIELLPPLVVEKIAAGEVIERPASVLKELIENAIDAGATRIDAGIEDAGFSGIRVADNGCGMDRADLARAPLRHATSKIRTADELYAITTMGFRGEALASIAAVSRLTITTSADAGGLGASIVSEGGVHGPVRPVAHGRGTTIEVRDLFYNVPARKKFMKGARSEQMAAVRAVEQIAAAFPLIHFTLDADGRRLIDLPIADTTISRIVGVAGPDFARELIECRASRPGIEIVTYVSSPEILHARPRFQSLYVNNRRVDSDQVTYAIREASGRFVSTQYRPSFFCFLTIDPARIDVNVHPTKQQVKFEDERGLFSFVFSAVKQGIEGSLVSPADFTGARPVAATESGSGGRDDGAVQQTLPLARNQTPPSMFSVHKKDDAGAAVVDYHNIPAGVAESIIPFPVANADARSSVQAPVTGAPLSRDQERDAAWDLISCYQIHEMYILAPIKNGILLIDQHAAHERILFEQALDDIGRGRSASQQLLFPVVIELSSVEKPVVLAGRAYFTSFGFEMDDFGGGAIAVSAIPFFMRTADVEENVRAIVRYLLDEKERDALKETEKRFAAAFACGAAIKAGQKLTQEEMNALVNSLFATKSPYTCPHGRPTLVRISLDELSRRFLR